MTATSTDHSKFLWAIQRQSCLRLLLIAIVIFVAFSILLPGKFLSVRNLQSMAVQFPEFGILAIAIMVTMITGGIDLSVVGAPPTCRRSWRRW